MMNTFPQTMKCLLLSSYDGIKSLEYAEKKIPNVLTGHVLVKMIAAPMNPSDVMFCAGLYGIQRTLPTIPGFEGCGTVVKSGGGFWANRLMGKLVACGNQEGDGTWAEYIVVNALTCLPLAQDTPISSAACALVNPVSAWALFEPLRKGQVPAMVQTAAASQLGRMILRLSLKYKKDVIHVVHRPALVDLLKKMGAKYVLDSSTSDFEQSLKEITHLLKATYAIDAVGGSLTGTVLAAMPTHSTIHVYGALSMESCSVNPQQFIFEDKKVVGFWLKYWIGKKNPLSLLMEIGKLTKMLDKELKTEVAATLSLEEASRELPNYLQELSKGKVLIKF